MHTVHINMCTRTPVIKPLGLFWFSLWACGAVKPVFCILVLVASESEEALNDLMFSMRDMDIPKRHRAIMR